MIRRIAFLLGAVSAGIAGCTTTTAAGHACRTRSRGARRRRGLPRRRTRARGRKLPPLPRGNARDGAHARGDAPPGRPADRTGVRRDRQRRSRRAPAAAAVAPKPSRTVDMAAPEAAAPLARSEPAPSAATPAGPTESEREFEQRASQRQELLRQAPEDNDLLAGAGGEPIPAGPREAIETYRKILETYPNYERNDQVLYQMSRAYDEIGQPDEAMKVMDRLVAEYPYSQYVDEVHFRRGEYYFVRRKYFDAEERVRRDHRDGRHVVLLRARVVQARLDALQAGTLRRGAAPLHGDARLPPVDRLRLRRSRTRKATSTG